MRILVENGSPHLRNLGDVAMLQVTVGRLQRAFPDARIAVLTDEPTYLEELCPGTVAFPLDARRAWEVCRFFPVLSRVVPRAVLPRWRRLQRDVWLRFPGQGFWYERLRACGRPHPQVERCRCFFRAVAEADAVVCCGGGLINDRFPANGFGILETLDLAQMLGKPTAMFGLGLGPVKNVDLRAKARRVLGRLDILGLREGLHGPTVLHELGLNPGRAVVTGDDAITLAYGHTAAARGTGIGVNVRLAAHAEVPREAHGAIATAVVGAARRFNAPIVPVPVMVGGPAGDLQAIEAVFGRANVDWADSPAFRDPGELIRQIHKCRVVVSISYHACVFALAQSIPAIALAASDYYFVKQRGLFNEFRQEGNVLPLRDAALETHLAAAIDRAWVQPPAAASLEREAGRQVTLSRQVYAGFEHIVKHRRRSEPAGKPGRGR